MTIKYDDIDLLRDPESAFLERPVSQSSYFVCANLTIKEGKLFLEGEVPPTKVSPSNEMLEDFVRLSNASDPKILAYSKKWGLLDLCEIHLKPACHSKTCEPIVKYKHYVFGLDDDATLEYRKENFLSDGEPLHIWRRYARFADALLRIAVKLYDDKLANKSDWENLRINDPEFLSPNEVEFLSNSEEHYFKHNLMIQKNRVARGIRYWLELGAVRPVIKWWEKRLVITFECDTDYGVLFGNLAIQLMLAICKSSGMAICSNCGNSYSPMRRPKQGQRRYCPNCKKAGPRDASADYRKRKKQNVIN